MDQYKAHKTEEFGMQITELHGIIEFVPAGCTSLGQPLDVSVMKSFKSHARNEWKRWKKENTDNDGSCENIGLPSVVRIVSNAWNAVDREVIENGFECAFRPVEIDAGPVQVLGDDEDVEENEGLQFVDIEQDELDLT